MFPISGCNSLNAKHKLNIKDLNQAIVNKDELCEVDKNYGLYKKGEVITFEIKFYSGVQASLLIDVTVDGNETDFKFITSFKYASVLLAAPANSVNVELVKSKLTILSGYASSAAARVSRRGASPASAL